MEERGVRSLEDWVSEGRQCVYYVESRGPVRCAVLCCGEPSASILRDGMKAAIVASDLSTHKRLDQWTSGLELLLASISTPPADMMICTGYKSRM